MSDLTRFRDHCKRMGGPVTQRTIHLTHEQRKLFRVLAAEVDAYLAGPALPSDADHDPIDYDDPIDEYRQRQGA